MYKIKLKKDITFRGVDYEKGKSYEVGIKEYPTIGLGGNSTYSCMTYWNPHLSMFNVEIKDAKKKIIEVNYERQSGKISVVPDIMRAKPFKSDEMFIKLSAGNEFSKPLVISSKHMKKELRDIDQLNEMLGSLETELKELALEFDKSMSNVYYVPAIRGIELPEYNLSDKYILDIPPIQNEQLATTFTYADEKVKEMVEAWSSEITGSKITVSVVPPKKVRIESSVAGGIPIIGDGFGANQLVQLLLMLAAVPKNSMLAIEEPEIHLHPKAQTKLVDILVEVSKSWDKQLIFTTHSEHMLYGFLSAVKDGRLSNKEVAIYYFEDKGSPPIYNEIDEGADIYDWGKHF